jgi:acyl-CoA dehydrogenase
VFGCQAPDSGNAEILAHYGTEEQKRALPPAAARRRHRLVLLDDRAAGGADPREFRCRAVRDGDEWVINGEKYFSSNADLASFLIVMAITDPDVPVHQGASMFLVPRDTPGLNIVRLAGLGGERLGDGHHRTSATRTAASPPTASSAGPGPGVRDRQTRLGGGRIHHAMRTVAMVKKALRMMCERALSRHTQGEVLANKQMVSSTSPTPSSSSSSSACSCSTPPGTSTRATSARRGTYIAAVKVQMAEVLHDVVRRAIQVHGAIGCSNELPLISLWQAVPVMAIADGPTEVHKVTVAKAVLKEYQPYEGLWPRDFLPDRVAEARARFAQ